MNQTQTTILDYLRLQPRGVDIARIALRCDVGWQTTYVNLEALHGLGCVEKTIGDGVTYYRYTGEPQQ